MHVLGFEPRSPAWKAGILAIELHVQLYYNIENHKVFINIIILPLHYISEVDIIKESYIVIEKIIC